MAVILLAAASFDLHNLINNAPLDRGIDFRVFERASTAPPNLVYHNYDPPFAYPPTALLLMKPLTALGYWRWIAVSGLMFFLSVRIVAGGKVAAMSFLSPSAIKGLVHGQTPMLLGSFLFAGLSLPPLLGGCVWGMAMSVKPHLMIFAPLVLLVRRDWPMLTGVVLGLLLMVTASLILLDSSLWWRWLEAMGSFSNIATGGGMIRPVTLAGAAAVHDLPLLPFILSGVALATCAVFIVAPKADGEQLAFLITAASLVASPYAHSYDMIALIPACASLLLNGRWVYAVPAGLVFVGTPFLTICSVIVLLGMMALESSSWRRFFVQAAK